MNYVKYCAATMLLFAVSTVRGQTANEILQATGVKGGLVVHLGCGDGARTVGLRQNERYLVQGLEKDAKLVSRARARIQKAGLYGPVSVNRLCGSQLPYADGLVNLVVAQDVQGVALDEIMRVLCPGGVAYVNERDSWKLHRKPWPREIGEWTHFLQDATNNGVAQDTRVGPPRRLKWKCAPLWSRSHEHSSSLVSMVTANGRLFYIFDEGLPGVTVKELPERWTLTARDAFNGVLLWKISIPKFREDVWNNRSLRGVTSSIRRLLVATGDRVYLPIGLKNAVSILDAATGKRLAVCNGTEKAQELRLSEGILVIWKGKEIVACDAETGKELWKAMDQPDSKTLAILNGKVFYMKGPQTICLALKTGKRLWAAGQAAAKESKAAANVGKKKRKKRGGSGFLLAHGDKVLIAAGGSIKALAVDTGKELWKSTGRLSGRGELFVTQGQAWHWEGSHFVGHDLATGKVKSEVRADDVFTPGHHLRCYQGKATENFIIAPHRGVEFVSLTGGENTESDWVRGACTYGVMPANGMLYTPPHPCMCYPGVLLRGFNALEPAGAIRSATGERLEKGPAYAEAAALAKAGTAESDWPTYRHDGRRSGSASSAIPVACEQKWQIKLAGKLTPPVVAHGLVYVAQKNAHTIHALSMADGSKSWQYIAGGSIDSPPTVVGKLVLFGCADGWVYCLRAEDGVLAWRFRAAPSEEMIVAFGRIESRWRVHGSILNYNGLVYCSAGRSTFLDGGIRLYALDPGTGTVVHEKTLDSWARTRADAVGKPFVPAYHIEGARSDVLTSEGGHIFMGQYQLTASLEEEPTPYVIPKKGDKKVVGMDLTGKPYVSADVDKTQKLEVHQRKWLENAARPLLKDLRSKYGAFNIGHRRMARHVLTTGGYLDDTWFNRTFWMYSESWPGFYLANRASKTGNLLVVGPEKTYAVIAYPTRDMQSPLFAPGQKGYLLVADANDNEPVLSDQTRETTKGWGFTRKAPPAWHHWVPIRMRAMVVAGKHLIVAGDPDSVDPRDPMAAFEGRKGAVLRIMSSVDGKTISEHKLSTAAVFDGLIAANGKLFMSTVDGCVVCLGEK